MGQIVSGAAKPKRCNVQSLSQLGTPAAGEYILVSSDNSMNAAGQGTFDCYIVGDGTTVATDLELKYVNKEVTFPGKASIRKTTFSNIGRYVSGSYNSSTTYVNTGLIPVSAGNKIVAKLNEGGSTGTDAICFFKEDRTYLSGSRVAGGSTNTFTTYSINAPAGAYYVAFTTMANQVSKAYYDIFYDYDSLVTIKKRLDAIESNDLSSIELLNKSVQPTSENADLTGFSDGYIVASNPYIATSTVYGWKLVALNAGETLLMDAYVTTIVAALTTTVEGDDGTSAYKRYREVQLIGEGDSVLHTYSFYAKTDTYVILSFRKDKTYSASIIANGITTKILESVGELSQLIGYTPSYLPSYTSLVGYVENSTNIVDDNDSYRYTSPIPMKEGETLTFRAYCPTTMCAICTCNADGSERVKVMNGLGNNAYYIHTYVATQDCYVILCYVYQYSATIKINAYTDFRMHNTYQASEYTRYADMLAYADQIVCIGDSNTAGHIYDYENYPNTNGIIVSSLSYPAKLAKMTGLNVTNLGISGASPMSWWNQNSAVDMSSYQVALIEFGYNGVLINTFDTENYDGSQLDYYCRIIDKCLADNPNMFIVLLISPFLALVIDHAEGVETIKAISSRYSIPYIDLGNGDLIDLRQARYHGHATSSDIVNTIHFNGIGYTAKATLIKYKLGKLFDEWSKKVTKIVTLE